MTVRVLHVLDHAPLGGGAQMSVKNLVESEPDGRYDHLVCLLRSDPATLRFRSEVIILGCRKWDPRVAGPLARLCEARQIGILHAHLQKAIIASLLAGRRCGIPVVIHERGAIFRSGFGCSVYRFLLRRMHRRAAAIVANSQATARLLVSKAGIPPERIRVIANPIDYGPFDAHRQCREPVRSELGLSQDDIVVGYAGRLHYVKGVDLLIQAVSLLLGQERRYRLVLLGDGPQRPSLESLAARLGIGDRVLFLGMRSDVGRILCAFDVGVVPSREEPFGRVPLEMMRMRLPVVSSGADGLAELVQHERTGLLTPDNTPPHIAAAIRRLVHEEPLRRRLAEAGFAFTTNFTVKQHVTEINEVYRSVLGDSQGVTADRLDRPGGSRMST